MKPIKFTLVRQYINHQGYDAQGCYWGVGLPLYYYGSEGPIPDPYNHGKENYIEGNLRAANREDAKEKVRKLYSGAVFHN
jgi:hypothetical protein